MSFEQFIATHHIADFVWEIFKGVSPTLVALFTIWINTRIGKKKTEKETFTNETKELQTRLTEFASIVVETGEYLLEAIQNANDKQKADEMFDLFYSKNKYMLREARKYEMYAEIRAEILKKECMYFAKEREAVNEYARQLIRILEWYNHEAAKTSLVLFDKLCDEVQRKLNEATNSVENVLFDYCVRLEK